MPKFTVDFFLMIVSMVLLFTLLVLIPLLWLPSSTLGLFLPHYEINVSNCPDSTDIDHTWYLVVRDGICNEKHARCMSFTNTEYWKGLDHLNDAANSKSNFEYAANLYINVEYALIVGIVAIGAYISGFITMMYGQPKTGMLTQACTLVIIFSIFAFIYWVDHNVDFINEDAWESSAFTHCDVTISSNMGLTLMFYILTTSGLLLFGTIFTSLAYSFFYFQCISKIKSVSNCCMENIGQTGEDEESLLGTTSKPNYSDTKKVLILMSATGGGHRMSAEAISTALTSLYGSKIDIEILDIWAKYARFPFTDIVNHYRIFSSYPWLWKISYDFTQFPITRLISEVIAYMTSYDTFRKAIAERNPDVVVSVHPLCQHMPNMIVQELNKIRLDKDKNASLMVLTTVVTDLITAHASWFSPETDITFAPTVELRDAAINYGSGITEDHFIVHGLPIRPVFWSPSNVSKSEMRTKLELEVESKTVLLMAGGDGVGAVQQQAVAVAKALGEAPYKSQLIVVCGHNKAMAKDLLDTKRVWPSNVKVVVLGFTTNIDEYMVASNLLITKAGPGTICEAMILGLPLILSSFLPGQEEGNVPYVVDNGLGYYTEDPQEIANRCVSMLTNDNLLQSMSKKALDLARPEATLKIGKDIGKICFREEKRFTRKILR